MAKHEVKCRICKQIFNTNEGVENVDWIMPSRNYYYHKTCYDTRKNKKDNIEASATEEEWWNITWEYLKVDVRIPNISNNFHFLKAQWNKFLKEGKTPKGIYFSLKFYYDVQHGNTENAQLYGIGIVKTIYPQACEYWFKKEEKKKGFMAQLEKEAQEKYGQKKIVVKTLTQKKKKTVDLSILETELNND